MTRFQSPSRAEQAEPAVLRSAEAKIFAAALDNGLVTGNTIARGDHWAVATVGGVMKTRLRAAIAAIAALAAAACLTAGPAGATHGDLYCLNGQTTTLPAGVAYSGGTASLTAGAAHAIVNVGGTFWAGFISSLNRSALWVSSTPPPPGTFEPGYSTNFVSLGACTVTGPPPSGTSPCASSCLGLTAPRASSRRSRFRTGTNPRVVLRRTRGELGRRARPHLRQPRRARLPGRGLQRQLGWQGGPRPRPQGCAWLRLQQHLPLLHEVTT